MCMGVCTDVWVYEKVCGCVDRCMGVWIGMWVFCVSFLVYFNVDFSGGGSNVWDVLNRCVGL